ncbi:MAG: hypothetical protein EBR82_42280 [Caulobacteraceae bacterium]|nr:hypothetical protein [Caulobacteraceae bacterium]
MPYYEQPGRQTTIDRDGKKSLTVTFIGDQEAPIPSDIRGVPRSKSVTRDAAGAIRTSYTYDHVTGGDGGGGGSDNVTVEIIGAVQSEPIETHPNYGGGDKPESAYIKREGLKIIQDAIHTAGKKFKDIEDEVRGTGSDVKRSESLYGYLAAGVTSYYVPTVVVRKTYVSAGPGSLSGVGKIRPPNCTLPPLPKKVNFLLINVSSRGIPGGLFQVTEEYQMSGPNGWDSWLYGGS